MSSAGFSGSILLASCSSSEITNDCSPSCSVVFEHTVVDLFDFDFDAEVSEDTEIDSFDFNAEATEVEDADAEILTLCFLFFFNFSLLSSCLVLSPSSDSLRDDTVVEEFASLFSSSF